jgi:DNA-binding LacI/PurR family transcriptional regulator
VELAAAHAVSRGTAATALVALAREGLVQRAPRRGTVVLESARQLEAGRGRAIAWIQPDIDYPFDHDLLRGIERATRQSGYNLLIYLTGISRDDEDRAIRAARTAGAAGIALCLQDGEAYNAEVLRLSLDRYPFVLVDRYLRGIQCASVQSNNVAGAHELVAALVASGHTYICAMVYPPQDTSTIEDRLDGYAQALADAGIPQARFLVYREKQFDVWADGNGMPEAPVTRFASYLTEHPAITAVFATNTALALLAWRASQRLGWRIPADLSVVSVDPLSAVPHGPPLFTCARQQGFEMGTTAVELLLEQMAGQPSRRVILPMQFENWGSITAPRSTPAGRSRSALRDRPRTEGAGRPRGRVRIVNT